MHPLMHPLLFAQTRLDTHVPSYMLPAGEPAGNEAALGWGLIIVAMLVVVVVAVVLLMALRRRSESESGKHENAPAQQGGGRAQWQVVSGVRWIYVGVAITVVILLASFGGTLVSIANASYIPGRKAPITLDVIAHQWWWEIRVNDSIPGDAFVTANEVHVPVGVPVNVRVRSVDVIHSFWVPELAGKMDVIPGQSNETWLRADRPGVYRGTCAEYCGLQHAHMAITVVAEPPAQYAAWAAGQRAEAVAPTGTGAAQAGEAVFTSSCGACHAVRGTEALGRVGPDLTHLASRLTIGAGMYDNTPANLHPWVHDAQQMKPGVFMPVMDLRQSDINAVVAYLQTLR